MQTEAVNKISETAPGKAEQTIDVNLDEDLKSLFNSGRPLLAVLIQILRTINELKLAATEEDQ